MVSGRSKIPPGFQSSYSLNFEQALTAGDGHPTDDAVPPDVLYFPPFTLTALSGEYRTETGGWCHGRLDVLVG